MSEEHQDKLLEALLDNRINLEEFKSQIGDMSEDALKKLRVKIKQRIEEKQTELYQVKRHLRNCKRYKENVEFNKGRVQKAGEWLGNQIATAFHAIFKNPEKAQQRAWAYEQKFGIEKTAKTFRSSPSTFGALHGMNLFGFKLGGREMAAAYVSNFDYAKNRMQFDKSRMVLGEIDNNIKRVK